MTQSAYVTALRAIEVPLVQMGRLSESLRANPGDRCGRNEMANAIRITRLRIAAIIARDPTTTVPVNDRLELQVAEAGCKTIEEILDSLADNETLTIIEWTAVRVLAKEALSIVDQLQATIRACNRSVFVKGFLVLLKSVRCIAPISCIIDCSPWAAYRQRSLPARLAIQQEESREYVEY